MYKGEHFSEWAAKYDAQVQDTDSYPFGAYNEMMDWIIENAMGETLLDMGCGTGLLASHFLSRGYDVTGIDFSEGMLEIAKSRMPQGRFIQADLSEGLPEIATGESFDVILANYVLHHFDLAHKARLIAELVGKLSPDGKMFIADVAFKTRQELESSRKAFGPMWDHEEDYIVWDDLAAQLKDVPCTIEFNAFTSFSGLALITRK